MSRACFTIIATFLLGTTAVSGQQDPALVGTWKGSLEGIPFELTLRPDGTGEFTGDPVRWRVQGNSLVLGDEDGSETYNFRLRGAQLTLTGGDLIGAVTMTRVGGAASAAAPPEPAPKVQARPVEPRLESARTRPAPAPAAAQGPRYSHDQWGLSFAVPGAWKVNPRQGLLLLGSDTEAGLMIIRFVRKTSLQQLAQEYGEGLEEEGIRLMPAAPAQDFAAGRNPGLAGELSGTAPDGAHLRGRIIAAGSAYGDAAIVLGLTTDEKYPGLKSRVESLAATFSFSRPKEPPVLEFLAGQYFYISASTIGSSERYLNLCSDGRFSERQDIYSSGSGGTGYGESGASARWTAEGDQSQGLIHVTYPNGNSRQFEYRKSGGDLIVDGRKYARYGDGSCTKTSVY